MSYWTITRRFGGLSGLPGAQDDADGLVLDFIADVLDEIEAGGVGFP